jgi:hypothetical protein
MRRQLGTGRVIAAVIAGALALAAPVALAASSAPAATTGAASALTTSGAQVSATVNPNGQATTYAFQYGTSTNYGSQTATAKAGSGTTAVSVHATLKGLVSGTTYHYRVVATNPSGTTAGADMTFETAPQPPSVTASPPSIVSTGSATLAGTINPHGKATTYSFQYGPTASYGLQSPVVSAGSGTSAVTVHAAITGLEPGTQYHYRLVALSADGTAASPDAMFSTTGTQAAPGGPLPAVSQTAAVNVGTSSVQLNGAVNPQGPTTTWYFQYGLSGLYGLQTSPQKMSGLGARPVNAIVGGLQSGTTYHYRLVAVSANGLYVGPDETFTTKQAGRAHPRALILHTSVHRRNGGVRLVLSGRLALPPAVTAARACRGAVALEIRRGGTTVGLRRASLRADCSYRLTTTVSAGALHHATRLEVLDRFEGNAMLTPASTRRTVRV